MKNLHETVEFAQALTNYNNCFSCTLCRRIRKIKRFIERVQRIFHDIDIDIDIELTPLTRSQCYREIKFRQY